MSGDGNSSNQSADALLEELTKFCRSKSFSEDGLHEIIERHGAAPNNNDPSIDYQFFHRACRNERITEGILRYLLEYFPNAARHAEDNEFEQLPLHHICRNSNVTLVMVKLLIDAFPDSVRHEGNNGRDLDGEEVGLVILKLLFERCPESVRRATRYGMMLPFHFAAGYQSPEFCRLLIEAYPGSERMADNFGRLPFHLACQFNTVATAKYLYQLYPESIYVTDNDGYHPIHFAIRALKNRSNPKDGIEVVRFLLDCDPNVVTLKLRDKLPLYWACNGATKFTSKLNVYLEILQILYDAHPEAIESNEVTSNVGSFCEQVQTFINTQLTYARQARSLRQMNTSDENGQLPLHKALRSNVTLGSTKLLIKGNPSAIYNFDNRCMIPLHVACQHHVSPAVVEYLIGLNKVTLTTADEDGNTALHHACRATNHAIIALLLEKYGSISVSKRNAHKQLPIDLLLQNKNEVSDNESLVYTESIYRLIRANPETLMHYDFGQAGSEDCLSQQSNKKRKIDEVYEMCAIQ